VKNEKDQLSVMTTGLSVVANRNTRYIQGADCGSEALISTGL
jgi:hypothetical protein